MCKSWVVHGRRNWCSSGKMFSKDCSPISRKLFWKPGTLGLTESLCLLQRNHIRGINIFLDGEEIKVHDARRRTVIRPICCATVKQVVHFTLISANLILSPIAYPIAGVSTNPACNMLLLWTGLAWIAHSIFQGCRF